MNRSQRALQQLSNSIEAASFRVYPMTFGCCDFEIESLKSASYDWSRLGLFTVRDPSDADLLLVSGWINPELQKELLRIYGLMRRPRYVVAIGACALSGSPYDIGEKRPLLVSDFLPVNVFVPGCPPLPEVIIDAIERLKKELNPDVGQREILQRAIKQTTVY